MTVDSHRLTDRKRWRRRAVSLTVLGVAAVVATPTAPLWLGLALCVDLLTGRTVARAGAFVLWYILHSVVGVGTTAVLYLGRGLGLLDLPQYIARHHALQHWWADRLFAGLRVLFRFSLTVTGDLSGPERPLIVLSRHVSTADTLLPMAVVAIPHRLRVRYILKHALLWDPCLDIVGQRIPNAFVRRGGTESEGEIARVRSLTVGLTPRDCIVLFPEGTRFTARRRARILEKLTQRGDVERLERAEALTHVLPPRMGGFEALMDSAPQADVVLMAHTGLEGVTRMSTLWDGSLLQRRVRVSLRRVPVQSIPQDVSQRRRWLHEQWLWMDQWVGDHL